MLRDRASALILPVALALWILTAQVAVAAEHVVRQGECLSLIARQRLGDAGRWQEIARLNGLQAPYRIRVGQRLLLPDDAAALGVQTAAAATEPAGAAAEPAAAAPPPAAAEAQPADAPEGGNRSEMLVIVAGFGIIVIGLVGWLVGFLIFEAAAFRQGFWWGVGTLLIQPVSLVFLAKFWDKAKKGFIVEVASSAVAAAGLVFLCAGGYFAASA